jgi:hypothetical protein
VNGAAAGSVSLNCKLLHVSALAVITGFAIAVRDRNRSKAC